MPDDPAVALLGLIADPDSDVDEIVAAAIRAFYNDIIQLVPPWKPVVGERGVVLIDLRQVDTQSGHLRVSLAYASESQSEAIYGPRPDPIGAAMMDTLREYDSRFEVLVVLLVRDTWAIARVARQARTA